MKMLKPIVCRTRVSNEDLIMRDHRVHQVRILPGVTYLDMIVRVLADEAFDLKELELGQIVFQEALATSEAFDKEVRITVSPLDPYGTIIVESRRVKGQDVLDAAWTTNLRCEVHRVPPASGRRLDVALLKQQATRITDMDEAYSFTRRMQIDHYTFMKGLGTVYESGDSRLAELKLSELAGQYAPYFHLHPAFLDSSTLVPGLFYFKDAGQLREEDFNKPFIPLVIESFRTSGRLGNETCYVYVPRSSVSLSANDLLYSDIELYNEEGVQVAVFNRMAIKKIRSASYMQQLLGGADSDSIDATAKVTVAGTNSNRELERAGAVTDSNSSDANLAEQLRTLIGQLLGKSPAQIRLDEGFYEQGMDSGDLLRLVRVLEEKLQVQLYPTLLFEYPTVTSLADYLESEYGAHLVVAEREQQGQQEVKSLSESTAEAAAAAAAERLPSVQARTLLCTPEWIAEELPQVGGTEAAAQGSSSLLLLASDRNRLQELAAHAESVRIADVSIILVKPGRTFRVDGDDEFEIDPSDADHYGRLLDELEMRNLKPDRIVHMWSWRSGSASNSHLTEQLETGIYSIHHITKTFAARRLPMRVLYLTTALGGLAEPHAAAFGGYAKSLALEDRRYPYASLELDERAAAKWPSLTLVELNTPFHGGTEVRYEGGIRYVKRLVRLDKRDGNRELASSLRPAGVYLITGGLGGLGWIIARHLASSCQARVVLSGRSAAPADWPVRLNELRQLGGDACYVQADLAEDAGAERAVAAAEAAFGSIHGVIHCAGVLRDSFASSKNVESMAEVFAPKLYGTERLDAALRGKPLDLFVLFSSLSAVAGNIGQSDYAYANGYMDQFAQRRNWLAARGERSGRAVAINWPLWRSGGMQVDRSTEDAIRNSFGFVPLETNDGLEAFEQILSLGLGQAVVLCGDEAQMTGRLGIIDALPVKQEQLPLPSQAERSSALADEPIAIIGVSGRYPMADDVEQFWDNLKNGRDCISEIPADRWDYRTYYDSEPGKDGRTNSKWGGFINGVDKFDSLFFHITPHEARIMDPQERLFLETVWHLMEDAGYTRSAVSGKKIGVYAGVMWGQYQMHGDGGEGKTQYPSSIYASIANRVSYFFNFQGPSMALDTMCSSSITAIHLACDSIRKGECVMAVAGGVNVTIHPDKYLYLSEHRFTSSDGRCRSFGEGGDGYVPGEGVGAILLKPLKQAEADGDYIYGVIRASSINHGGKTSGYSVPSPAAQRNLIADTIAQAGIDARTISYIEAHGTGTSLGDPIEIAGLTQAFAPYHPGIGVCPIGSAKSNIGHLESAAGIAGITKVLLQLKHKQLAPSIHSDQLNGAIPFGQSPFYVQQTVGEWKRPVTVTGGITAVHPRRAGISTFGAGGSNAHLIIEEYERTAAGRPTTDEPVLLVLSAKDRERLREYAGRIAAWLRSQPDAEDASERYGLKDIAYTLQLGREPMEDRLALWTSNLREASVSLERFSKTGEQTNGLYVSGEPLPQAESIGRDGAKQGTIVFDLLEKWIGGGQADWHRLYDAGADRAQRIPVPGYPFARISHWIKRKERQTRTDSSVRYDVLHPLVHRNTSDLTEQKYTTLLTKDMFFVEDHQVLGQFVVPGAAIMEMARAAGAFGAGTDIRRLESVVWQEPLRVGDQPLETSIGLYMNGPDVEFQVYTAQEPDGKVVHGFGTIRLLEGEPAAMTLSLEEVMERCPERIGSGLIYERLSARGIEYGPSMRAITELRVGDGESVARLELPPSIQEGQQGGYWLHPTLTDGALQAVIGLMDGAGTADSGQYLPFHVEKVTLHEKLTPVCWAIAARNDDNSFGSTMRTFDITVVNEEGRVLLRLERLSVKRIEDGLESGDSEDRILSPEERELVLRVTEQQEPEVSETSGTDLTTQAEKMLKDVLSEETGIPLHSIKGSEPLDKYGIDSVMVLSLTAKLEKQFGPLSKTLLFEYRTLSALSDYLVRQHSDTLRSLFGEGSRSKPIQPAVQQKPVPAVSESAMPVRTYRQLQKRLPDHRPPYSRGEGMDEPIAIIGLAGRYPQARDIEQFWNNLRSGADCITEIPLDRWDYEKWTGSAGNKTGVYSKWGGFIDDVDKFDPLFFQISPREAEKMDPQERLFLEVAWETLEDGACTRTKLAGESVGVFVGAMYGHYQLFGAEALAEGKLADVNSSFASIANRVSYTFDLHGPSLTVDTMCSSSLYSVHLACESIRRGECTMALAGGVNVTIHPSKYVLLSEGKFASSEGKCRSFGEGGDGYVPGEGVGAVLLKPLSRAEADGDRIYGVIRGSAVNHGGRTNGYTVPNPGAQSDVIAAALKRSGVHPETIGYIEAHGTGTALGDPIEIGGLVQAFGVYTEHKQFCAIGSVKSNIGHLESAAGIAALTKVLLQMKYGELVPSLHAESLNRNIDFGSTPFYVQRQLEQWPRYAAANADSHGIAQELPRRAGISSFGAGGANAHLIVEEYVQSASQSNGHGEKSEPHLILLSAKNEERLAVYAARLADDLESRLNGPGKERYTLRAIAATLQLGREEMNARCAWVVQSAGQLLEQLRQFSQGRTGQWFAGNTETSGGMLDQLLEGPEWEQFARLLIDGRNWSKLGQAWAAGAKVNWQLLHQNARYDTVALAAYPFARERYWLDMGGERVFGLSGAADGARSLHPLLDRNDSSFDEICFEKTFQGGEFYLEGHRYDGVRTLPGAVYVAMAQAAFSFAARQQTDGIMLEDIVWHRPFKLEDQERQLRFALLPEGGDILFEAYTEQPGTGARIIYCSGRLAESPANTNGNWEDTFVSSVRSRFAEGSRLSGEDFYKRFESSGLQYSGAMRPVQEVWRMDGAALARLEISSADGYSLHPALLDGALQTAAAVIESAGGRLAARLPYSVDRIDIAGPLPNECYVVVSEEGGGGPTGQEDFKCTIRLADMEGRVLVQMEGAAFRLDQRSSSSSGEGALRAESRSNEADPSEPMLFRPVWLRSKPAQQGEHPDEGTTLIFAHKGIEQWADPIVKGAVIVHPGFSFKQLDGNRYEVNPSNQEDYQKLLEELNRRGEAPRRIVQLWSQSVGLAIETASASEADTSIGALFYLCKAYLVLKLTQPVHLVYGFATRAGETMPMHAAVGGFMHSLRKENPLFRCTLVEWKEQEPANTESARSLLAVVRTELEAAHDGEEVREIRWENGSRYVRAVQECGPDVLEAAGAQAVKAGGVYLITGGMGGLGLVFARHLAKSAPVKLVLAGRSKPDRQRIHELTQSIRTYGSEVVYLQADVTSREDVRSLIRSTKETFGPIDGIIHCSGVLRDSFLLFKTKEQFDEVLAPKLNGTVYLDEETRGERLDFFVLCSSISSLFGNVGQCDYAYANRFMDAYAEQRSQQVRYGRSLSVNWPLWAEGGMKVDGRLEHMLEQSMGIRSLGSAAGIRALEQGLNSKLTQLLPLQGNPSRIRASILGDIARTGDAQQKPEPPSVSPRHNVTPQAVRPSLDASSSASPLPAPTVQLELRSVAERFVTAILSDIIKLPPSRINVRTALESYGIDSVMIVRMNEELEKAFGPLPKTLLYEYQSIAELAAYLVEQHAESISARLMPQPVREAKQAAVPLAAASETISESGMAESAGSASVTRTRFSARNANASDRKKTGHLMTDIAIIGLDGKYPMASTLEQFWSNLAEGKDCVTEIPQDRWSVTPEFYDPDRNRPGTSYSKWGGFIDEADRFDPLFFGISPKDAKGIDPQERLFLESVWRTVEDAGYTRNSLNRYKVGVFAGVMYGQYQLFAAEEHLKGNPVTAASSFASIANRVSHFFNFRGPSIALDTMCSSSLTAIHLACESIRRGESQLAIAGGVNLSIHPNKYVLLSRGTFVSSDGRCRSFGEGGDGYVPGEGVGAVLLKPLELAEADGDRIYGVIKATAVNHGGKTNGYTVPSPAAQGEVIAEALKQSGIDPRTISFIEAHGTGTPLGDPIEIAGLSKAFEAYTLDKGFCSIGSLKSNIGHLESAAGIAGLTKVLLQMNRRQLVPSLHSGKLNANINFADTPFYVQRSLTDWEQPVLTVNGAKVQLPRRAGISSFGAGGSNAHIIVEEYAGNAGVGTDHAGTDHPDQQELIVLSARNKDRLKQAAQRLADDLRKGASPPVGVRTSSIAVIDGTPISGRAKHSELLQELSEVVSAVTGVPVEAVDRCEAVRTYLQDGHQAGAFAEYVHASTYSELSAAELAEFGSLSELAEALEPKLRADRSYSESCKKGDTGDAVCREISLRDLAYTLQTGREAMTERIAFSASDIQTVIRVLEQYAGSNEEAAGVYSGHVNEQTDTAWAILASAEGQQFVEQLIGNRQLDSLAQLWVSGVPFDWSLLHNGARPKRLQLPTYPFARERYWVDIADMHFAKTEERSVRMLHPLVEINESTFKQTRFTASLKGGASAWQGGSKEHSILSGAAMLEMARFAGAAALEQSIYSIADVKWAKPVLLKEAMQGKLAAMLQMSPDGIRFEVRLEEEGQRRSTVMTRGWMKSREAEPELSGAVWADLNPKRMTGPSAAAVVSDSSMPGRKKHNRIQLTSGNGEVLLSFRTEAASDSENAKVQLPIELLEAALQSIPDWNESSAATGSNVYVPVSMDELLIRGDFRQKETLLAAVTTRQDGKLNIRIADETGRVGIVVHGLKARTIERQPVARVQQEQWLDILQRVWNGGQTEEAVQQLMGERHE